ncbi:hypothetical protein F5Y03DRAFT_400015 [Xylaria venustula]|nr:hypothetical protein F5Y03DRAFT_400015 [Xylaria venustula]
MSFDEGALLDSYGSFAHDDETIIPIPGLFAGSDNNFDYGTNFSDEFDHIFNASSTSDQAAFGCQDDWLVEFYKLQAIYFESQLALYRQALDGTELPTVYGGAAKAALPPGPPLIIDNTHHDELPSSASSLSEWSQSSIPSRRCSSNMAEFHRQSEPLTIQPKLVENETVEDVEGLRGRKSGAQAPPNGQVRDHGPDDVPLYNHGACNAAAAVSQLKSMENGLRAETTRRIAQVQNSRIQ